jgi:hypothetical protein
MEIYILRDIIIHNHLWEMEFTWEDNGISVTTAKKRSTGDTKYSQSVDVNTRQTKVLGLTINPIKVGKLEITSVLQAVRKIGSFWRSDRNVRNMYISTVGCADDRRRINRERCASLPFSTSYAY